ncbi:MAG: Nif3-like dinuclear metal center hexameric protein [Mailhella sp.]|nr:Nif3-like dinuclear metal center hexameric protein [Mailhella sp.]
MQQQTVIDIIEQTAPLSLMADWDHSGIQVASSRKDIRRLAVCLDPLPEQIALAVQSGADMVLSHHPLAMHAQWTDSLNTFTDALRLLYAHDIPLYASHTTLDANPLGPSAWLPDELGLTERLLLEKTGFFASNERNIEGGFGCVGNLPQQTPFAALLHMLDKLLPGSIMRTTARLAGRVPDAVSRVAVCTGSGASLTDEAAAAGAELYITGDVKYHDALLLLARNSKGCSNHCSMAILDVGHFSLEEEMMRRFALLLKTRLCETDVIFLPGRDPFQHVTFLSEEPEILS